ncbi:MAG: hypothetical protein Fues2KO_16190 [Fuerstiella sp.]
MQLATGDFPEQDFIADGPGNEESPVADVSFSLIFLYISTQKTAGAHGPRLHFATGGRVSVAKSGTLGRV